MMKTLSHQTQHLCYLAGKPENIMNENREKKRPNKSK